MFLTSPKVLETQSRCSLLELSNRVLSKCVSQLSLGAAGTEQVQFFGALLPCSSPLPKCCRHRAGAVLWCFLSVFLNSPQVLQAQSKCSLLEQQLERERQKAESLVTLMDSERQQQAALQEQEQAVGKQLRQDLSQAKVSCWLDSLLLLVVVGHASGLARLDQVTAPSQI